MKLGDKIPIELSEARAARIARGLFEKLDMEERRDARRTRRPPAAVIVGAMAVAACLALFFGVRWHNAGTELHVAAMPAHVPAEADPSRIVTGDTSSHLVFGDVSLDVAPQSALVATGDDDRGMLVVLDRGSVTCEVAPRRGRPAFVVQAGGVRVRVVGTRFTVTREGDDARVNVAHGTVEVSAGGVSTLVRDGESWPPGREAEIVRSPVQSTGGAPAVEAPVAPAPEGVVHRRRARGGAAASAEASRPEVGRSVESDTPPTRVVVAGGPSDPPSASAGSATATSASAASASATPPPLRTPSPQELFEQAAGLEGHDPARAMAIYEGLAAGRSTWAPNALFAEASLEQARGNTPRARALFERYVTLYPKGQNSQDAHTMLERLK